MHEAVASGSPAWSISHPATEVRKARPRVARHSCVTNHSGELSQRSDFQRTRRLSLRHGSVLRGEGGQQSRPVRPHRRVQRQPGHGVEADPRGTHGLRRPVGEHRVRRAGAHGQDVGVSPPPVVSTQDGPEHGRASRSIPASSRASEGCRGRALCSSRAPPGTPQTPPWWTRGKRCWSSTPDRSGSVSSSPAAPRRPQCRQPWAQVTYIAARQSSSRASASRGRLSWRTRSSNSAARSAAASAPPASASNALRNSPSSTGRTARRARGSRRRR